jgi:hypothetical protein
VIVLKILIGIVLLLLGRKLFWLFVAAMDFIVAMSLLVRLFPDPEAGSVPFVALVAGLAAGLIGALLEFVVRARSMKGLAEEAPLAYKDVNCEVEVVHGLGIAGKVARLQPLAVPEG